MNRHWSWLVALGMLLCLVAWLPVPAQDTAHGDGSNSVRLIPVDGAIGPATSRFIQREIAAAQAAHDELIILRLDTPGGLSSATRDIVQAILASPVPVAGYVAPGGARAASAGTYILYATHIAAMAPTTHLGAATPVSIGGGGALPSPQGDEGGEDQDKHDSSQSAERHKVVNDAVAFIRSLAARHDRNADWAEQAVRTAASLTANEALEKNVIDLMADDQADLLASIDGMSVQTQAGTVQLDTASAQVTTVQPGWRLRFLGVITQPTIAYMLLMVGIFGLLLEGMHPGAVLPGIAGGICLLVALYAFQILPVNFAGLGLIALGVALMIGEVFAPSGILGVGGVAAFAFGSVMLMDTDVPGYQAPFGLIIGLSLVFALLILLVIALFIHARRKRVHTGSQGLIGMQCTAMTDFDGEGRVWLRGESWLAQCDHAVRRNDVLEVVASEGLRVKVRRADASPATTTDTAPQSTSGSGEE